MGHNLKLALNLGQRRRLGLGESSFFTALARVLVRVYYRIGVRVFDVKQQESLGAVCVIQPNK